MVQAFSVVKAVGYIQDICYVNKKIGCRLNQGLNTAVRGKIEVFYFEN